MRRFALALLAVAAAAAHGPAAGQDAMRGKRLYLDVGRITGAGVSCVDCHLGMPPGLFGIGRAANLPSVIEQAVASVPLMAPLRGRLAPADFADLAAYIGHPAVPSPDARVVTSGPAAIANDPSRLEFGNVPSGGISPSSIVQIRNAGAVPLTLLGAPLLAGDHPQDFSIVASDCRAGLVLASQQSCAIALAFRPSSNAARQAALRVPHDWVGGQSAVALLGNGAASAPPIGNAGGGGGLPAGVAVSLAVAGLLRRRR